MKRILLLLIVMFHSGLSLFANNLTISNVQHIATNQISFDISWDNSWYLSPLNYDAAWVFVKYQDCSTFDRLWTHTKLSPSSVQHTSSNSLLVVDAVSDSIGVFIRRNADGSGSVSSTITLRLGTTYPIGNINFDVIGIEMCYVPQGAYYAGDGASSTNFNNKRYITSEAQLAASNLGGTHSVIPAFFPKGYNAFYCMKYEITQGQYCHFLNRLTYTQQEARTAWSPNSARKTNALSSSSTGIVNRNGIQIDTSGVAGSMTTPAVYGMNLDNDNIFNENEDGATIACNFLSWDDLIAYLDWSGLRPMTELEYEKACRGPKYPQNYEYAWGNTLYNNHNYSSISNTHSAIAIVHANLTTVLNAGTPNETSVIHVRPGLGIASMNWGTSYFYGSITPTIGSSYIASNNSTNSQYSSYSSIMGPFRVGFAATPTAGRDESGATYYGIMEMTGNVAEQAIQVRFSGTIVFDGKLGDGNLTFVGGTDVSGWGSASDNHNTIVKGGGCHYITDRQDYFVSSRNQYSNTNNVTRDMRVGGRGVRQF